MHDLSKFKYRLVFMLVAFVLALVTLRYHGLPSLGWDGASVSANTLESGEAGLSQIDTDTFADFSMAAQRIALALLVILVIAIVTIAVFSATPAVGTHNLIRLAAGPSANHLFLGIKFRVDANDEQVGYLRSIGLQEADIVSSLILPRGKLINLEMGTLPGFTALGLELEARVTKSTLMGGEPPSFLVKVKFTTMTPEARTALLTYIEDLSKSSGRVLSHA